MSERVRILIADDHPVVRMGLRGMLSGEPGFEVVAEATDGAEAVTLAARHRPDVVLMDLRMPHMDGVGATKEIKSARPEINVLVLTTYDSDADILKAIETGATGYLLKDAAREDLFSAIKSAAKGEASLASPVAARLMQRAKTPGSETLSAREIEVLELVATGKNNKEIARELWIGETTVKSHLFHAYEKLGVADRAAAVAEAIRREILRLER